MKAIHLETAIAETAAAYAGHGSTEQAICEALRGVRARATRYEANDPDPHGEQRLRMIVREEIEKLLK